MNNWCRVCGAEVKHTYCPGCGAVDKPDPPDQPPGDCPNCKEPLDSTKQTSCGCCGFRVNYPF